MVIMNTIAGKVVGSAYDALTDKRKRERRADTVKQERVPLTGTLSGGESKVVAFNSAEKDTALRKHQPFSSIDVYNGGSEDITVEINEIKDLRLPVPTGAQNGDSFEDIGIKSIRIVNQSSANSIDLSKINVIVSGGASGISRGSV